jgi:nucleoside-diphosphate-sugar epimerase
MNETVIVTGALGGAGSWIVERLRFDYDVVAVDLELPADLDVDGVSFQAVDLTGRADTWETVVDHDPAAVVHFGNIPHEGNHAGGHVYENNALSTFNVLEAAGRAGADVVWASSETVYGTHYPEPELPERLPVTVDHPTRPWNAYETSKLAGEAAAERVTNAYDVAVASVRPSWIQYPGRYVVTEAREAFTMESADRSGNLWSYVDVRDVVDMVEAVLDAEFEGHEILNAFAADNYLGVPTAEAIEAGYGSLPDECDLAGEESGFSTASAQDLLDWEPTHSWRDAQAETVSEPSFA